MSDEDYLEKKLRRGSNQGITSPSSTVRVIDRRSKMSKLRTQLKTLPILDLNAPAVLSQLVLSKIGIKPKKQTYNNENIKSLVRK